MSCDAGRYNPEAKQIPGASVDPGKRARVASWKALVRTIPNRLLHGCSARREQVYHPAAYHAPRALGVMLSLLAAVRLWLTERLQTFQQSFDGMPMVLPPNGWHWLAMAGGFHKWGYAEIIIHLQMGIFPNKNHPAGSPKQVCQACPAGSFSPGLGAFSQKACAK